MLNNSFFSFLFVASIFFMVKSFFYSYPSTQNTQGEDYALIFAIEDYSDTTWTQLKNPISDAKALKRELEPHFDFNVYIYENKETEKQAILDILDKWRQKEFNLQDQLFVFFSGHGTIDKNTNTGYFIPQDGKKSQQQSYLALTKIAAAIDAIPCTHTLLAFDVCHSGFIVKNMLIPQLKKGGAIPSGRIDNVIPNIDNSRIIITTGLGKTPDGNKRSPFVRALVDVLRSTYESRDSTLYVDELIGELKNTIPQICHGRFCSDHWGDFIFTVKKNDNGFPIPLSPYPKMIKVTGGYFNMGTDGIETESPKHEVNITGFKMAETEITVLQYMTFAKAKQGHYPKWYIPKIGLDPNADIGYKNLGPSLMGMNHPIVGIDWDDAVAYCNWLSMEKGQDYRLPSEAEWEYAARGGNTSTQKNSKKYNYSKLGNYAWYKLNSNATTQPVKRKKENRFGIYDMQGNVEEWCQDTWENNYITGPYDESPRLSPSIKLRVLRGGYFDSTAENIGITKRRGLSRDSRANYIGFRPVCSL